MSIGITVTPVKVAANLSSIDQDSFFSPSYGDETDLWTRIEQGMSLADNTHRPRVISQINWYSKHPDYINRVAERALPFLYLIMEEIEKRNMPAEIALLPVVESAFQPFAYSHGRAAGIWQFIPSTGRLFGLKQNWWYDGRRDIIASTKAALDYLQASHRRLNNDWLLALAAYNSGEGTVRKAIRKNRKKGKPTDFWNLDLPKETRAYVPKLLAISSVIVNALDYNIILFPIANEPRLVEVDINTQIDLALVAQLADITLEDVYRLNPAYNRWATEPGVKRKILIPLEKEQQFKAQLANIPKSQHIQWKRHKVKNGETLSHIAKKYHTTVKLLKQVNSIRRHHIRKGKHLLIPLATRSLKQYSLTQPQRTSSKLKANRQGHKIIITIKNGDTFWDLSRKYKVSVRKIAKWNGMAPRDTLKPGTRLVLWLSRKNTSNHLINSRLPANTVRKIHYTVRQGDSLARISTKFRVTIRQLRKWNHLPKGKYLQPGQRLKLYVDVTKQT
ncbi:MAG: LysM peptidoglycan-binding domain-containing protein [Gammaproteobacteria bacterium]|nr:LysM peptidoglycan-binding domain-containing protein [Gammaproteobacteria bacterium]